MKFENIPQYVHCITIIMFRYSSLLGDLHYIYDMQRVAVAVPLVAKALSWSNDVTVNDLAVHIKDSGLFVVHLCLAEQQVAACFFTAATTAVQYVDLVVIIIIV